MITKLTGTINRVAEDELRLQVGPIEFQVLIPESVRSAVQMQLGNLVTCTSLIISKATRHAEAR